jgi:hypothetical protein
VIPNGLGVLGVIHGRAGDGIAVRTFSLGAAEKSLGEVGSEGYCVRDRLADEVTDEQVEDPEEKADRSDDRDDDLLRAREKTDEDEETFEKIESVGDGNVAESGVIPVDGTWTSFRMTIKEKWRFFRASLDETYSNAVVTSVGNLLTSNSEEPASSG